MPHKCPRKAARGKARECGGLRIMSNNSTVLRDVGVQLANRVITTARAVKEAERTNRSVDRASRRRSRARHVTLPKVTLGRDLYVEPAQRLVDDPTPEAHRDPSKPPLPVQAT